MWVVGLLLLVSEVTAFNVSLTAFNDAWSVHYPERKSNVRRQRAFPPSMPFPCQDSVSWGRSRRVPTSVHRLRPGDIDVVAAIGDSLVAGSGALEEYALGAFVEYRGISWCAGGDSTWREFLTLPNILKEYNPHLRGYSTGTGEWLAKNSRLNVAFPVASDQDACPLDPRRQDALITRHRHRSPLEDGNGVHRSKRPVLSLLPVPGFLVAGRARAQAGARARLPSSAPAAHLRQPHTGVGRVGVGARVAAADVSADAPVVLHVLPPRRRRTAGPRASGAPVGSVVGGERSLRLPRGLHGGGAAVHEAVQRPGRGGAAAARHPPVLHHARLLSLLAEGTRAGGKPAVEQPAGAGGQQVVPVPARAAARLPLPERARALPVHGAQLARAARRRPRGPLATTPTSAWSSRSRELEETLKANDDM